MRNNFEFGPMVQKEMLFKIFLSRALATMLFILAILSVGLKRNICVKSFFEALWPSGLDDVI